jgi:hypothetical protein
VNDLVSGRADILTAEGARDLTDQIRVGLEGVFQLIKAAYRGRAWVSLGFGSWDEYVSREFGNLHLRPPREDRQEVVRSLHEAGMSVRAIAAATQLGRGSVARELEEKGVPNGTPEGPKQIQGRDGKSYPATRLVTPLQPRNNVAVKDAVFKDPVARKLSIEDVLDLPASVAGVQPLDLSERADAGRDRISRMLREFHGSGSAALPMTIKLASQVAGLVSPLTGQSQVPAERLHELAYDVSRGVCTLSHVAMTLRESTASGESQAAIKANLRDARDELDRVVRQMEASS